MDLTLDPDVEASAAYESSSGASGSRISDTGHGNINFGDITPASVDSDSGMYGSLVVEKKTIGITTRGTYYTVYLSMSGSDHCRRH